jgi:hypothetical protein
VCAGKRAAPVCLPGASRDPLGGSPGTLGPPDLPEVLMSDLVYMAAGGREQKHPCNDTSVRKRVSTTARRQPETINICNDPEIQTNKSEIHKNKTLIQHMAKSDPPGALRAPGTCDLRGCCVTVVFLYFGCVFCCISGPLQMLIAVWAMPDIKEALHPPRRDTFLFRDSFVRHLANPTWSRNGSRIELRMREPYQNELHNMKSRGPSANPKNHSFRDPAETHIGTFLIDAARKSIFQTAPAGLPEVVPHPGPRNRCFVKQHYIRDMISAVLFAQNPNPASIRAYAACDMFDLSLRVAADGGHVATAS